MGRVIFRAPHGPVALPVNFRYSNGEVLFNTTLKTAIELESHGTVGFEIDRIDEVFSEGWSVIVTGSARLVDHPDELVEHAAHGLVSWAGGARGAVVAITADEVTGRVIVHGRVERGNGAAKRLGHSIRLFHDQDEGGTSNRAENDEPRTAEQERRPTLPCGVPSESEYDAASVGRFRIQLRPISSREREG